MPSVSPTCLLVLFLPLLSLASAYVAPHPNGPLGLKDGDDPLVDYKQYNVRQRTNEFYTDSSKFAATRLRPEPSDELPIIPIKFPPGMGPPPEGMDLLSRQLRKILGNPVDKRYLGEKEPLDNILRPNGTLVYRFKKGRPIGKMPKEFENLKFTIPERRSSIRIKSKKTRRKVKQFLWAYSYCPVLYRWRDLGERFWPRWIREGSCYNDRPSCSFPAGMTCKPRDKTDLFMLYWNCRAKSHCEWIKFQYSIITQCGCGC